MFAFPVSKNSAGPTGTAKNPHRLVSIRALGASALLTLAPAILVPVLLETSNQAFAQISISVTIAPPPLPVYEQPPIPDDGYIWTPGYWDYGDDGYYWVPGTWVQPPYQGALWTPGYWGYGDGGAYLWHSGYWGAVVGFYGGINYGYGYGGRGYEGGYWNGGRFSYNRSVNNISNVHITNVYNKTVYNNVTANRVSFNGRGGIDARPTQQQIAAEHDHRVPPTSMQMQHQQAARADRAQFASVNHGQPAVAATPRPGAFTGGGVVHANPHFATPASAPANHLPGAPTSHPAEESRFAPHNGGAAPGPAHPAMAVPNHVQAARPAEEHRPANFAPPRNHPAAPMARPAPPHPGAPHPAAVPHPAPPSRPAVPHPQGGEKPHQEEHHP